MSAQTSQRLYAFGDSDRAGLLLGLSVRQSIPIVAGVVWLALWLAAGVPLVAVLGPCVGLAVSFGSWRRTPLFEVAAPGVRLAFARWTRRTVWTRTLIVEGSDATLPGALRGIEIVGAEAGWWDSSPRVAVVRDVPAGTVSVVLRVVGDGFAVASAGEQDDFVAGWGSALAPLARAMSPVSKLTWQAWTRPSGVDGHRRFLDDIATVGGSAASADYDDLLTSQAPYTVSHTVLVTLTVDIRKVRATRRVPRLDGAVATVLDEARLLSERLDAAGIATADVLSPAALANLIRLRSDPSRRHSLPERHSLSAAAGRVPLEWGPMAVEPAWSHTAVDGSVHRSYRIAGWPMLPVGADWMAPLLTSGAATRTVSLVLEPVALQRAAREANRQLTSIEADRSQKEAHGFRLTARERRRQTDIESRERELAEGHPEFRHVGLLTVTASTLDELDDAAATVEQAAAQSLLDLRPLAARQVEGWAASLPLGRSVRQRIWP